MHYAFSVFFIFKVFLRTYDCQDDSNEIPFFVSLQFSPLLFPLPVKQQQRQQRQRYQRLQ